MSKIRINFGNNVKHFEKYTISLKSIGISLF